MTSYSNIETFHLLKQCVGRDLSAHGQKLEVIDGILSAWIENHTGAPEILSTSRVSDQL